MTTYFQNKKTGVLVALDLETNEITEFEPIVQRTQDSRGGGQAVAKNKQTIRRLEDLGIMEKKKGGDKCIECGKERKPGKYFCKGMCATCYARRRYNSKNESPKVAGRLNHYECLDCGREIDSPLDIETVVCPKDEFHKLVQK